MSAGSTGRTKRVHTDAGGSERGERAGPRGPSGPASGFVEAMLVFLIGATAIRTDEGGRESAAAEADPTDPLGGVAHDETVSGHVAGDDGAGADEGMTPDS